MTVQRHSIRFAGLIGVAMVAAGCSANQPTEPSSSAPSTAGPKAAPAATPAKVAAKRPAAFDAIKAPADRGVIIGRVLYQGTPPKPKPISFGGEKLCSDLYKDGTPNYETLVVGPEGTVKWALVSIRGNVPGDHKPPDKPVVMDQIGCVFVPHVVGMMAGQEIEYRNSDPVSHNIRANPKKNPAFNTIFSAKMNTKSRLELAEFGIPLKCDIHFWMSSYVHVLPHPFFAVTGDDGSFVLKDVPPGDYSLISWHETLKTQTQQISVKAGEVAEVDFMVSGN
jgi:plastocyanin